MKKIVEPKTQTHHGRVGSGGAQRGGWARRAPQDGTPTGFSAQDTTIPRVPQGIENNCLEHFFGNTNTGNPMETGGGTKPTVDPRLIIGTRSALCSWLLTSGPTPICPCKFSSCKACSGMLSRSSPLGFTQL